MKISKLFLVLVLAVTSGVSTIAFAEQNEPLMGKLQVNSGNAECPATIIVAEGNEKYCAKFEFVDSWLQQSVARMLVKHESLIFFGEFEKRQVARGSSKYIYLISYVSAALE
ncbi:hypothetical protein [Bdellovibrio bacteriovorus]|uniref:hypothetical protein n=1 Tax=Bdellovibrio bacteriovorus TaxID=959 RepID=UPI0005A02E65|nr:hypothetical protein [Bdellovibrio bacteriovorus]